MSTLGLTLNQVNKRGPGHRCLKGVCLIQGTRWGLRRGSLRWRHNGRDDVSNHQPHDCLLNRLFRRRSKKTSKLRVTGLCARNSPGTGEFPAQMASYAATVSIWWRHHVIAQHDVTALVICFLHIESWINSFIQSSHPFVRSFVHSFKSVTLSEEHMTQWKF